MLKALNSYFPFPVTRLTFKKRKYTCVTFIPSLELYSSTTLTKRKVGRIIRKYKKDLQ